MKALLCLPLAILCSTASLNAATLGEAIAESQKPQQEVIENALCSVMNGTVLCSIHKLNLARILELPDCRLGKETYSASKGCVLLIIQGEAQNQGKKAAHFQIPDFVSASDGHYEEEDSLRYLDTESAMMSVKLNPNERYRFVCFFEIPLKDILRGKLVFEKALFTLDDDNETDLPLPITETQEVEPSLSLPNVTDF